MKSLLKKTVNLACLFTIFLIFSAFKFPESKLAHQYLDGLRGVEIAGAAYNPFGLNTLNVDISDDYTSKYKQFEVELCGEYLNVDVIARGDELPFKTGSLDFVVNSFVLQVFFDPIKAIKEWLRVVKPGGYVFMIIPHKDRTMQSRPRTKLNELITRHKQNMPSEYAEIEKTHSVWITEDIIELCDYYGWQIVEAQDVDDKVGNGFTIVLQKAE